MFTHKKLLVSLLTIAFGGTVGTVKAERYVRPEVKKIRALQAEIKQLNKENAQLETKKAEDPAAEDPAAEDPAAEDPAAEDPAAEDPEGGIGFDRA